MKAKQVTILGQSDRAACRRIFIKDREGLIADLDSLTSLKNLTVGFNKTGAVIVGGTDAETGEVRKWVLSAAVPVMVEVDLGEDEDES
jgi:hypothetical protein